MLVVRHKLFSALLLIMLIISQTITISYSNACDVEMYQMSMNKIEMSNMSDDQNDCCDNYACTMNCNYSNGVLFSNITSTEVLQTSVQKYTLFNSLSSHRLPSSLFRPPILG